MAKLDELESSPKLETLEWWKADLNRPKEGSIKSPNSQMAKLDELESSPKLETVEYNKADLNRYYNTNRLNFFL